MRPLLADRQIGTASRVNSSLHVAIRCEPLHAAGRHGIGHFREGIGHMLPTLPLLPGLALMTLAGFYGSARDDIASRPAPVTNSVSIASISSDSAALSLTIGASSAVTFSQSPGNATLL